MNRIVCGALAAAMMLMAGCSTPLFSYDKVFERYYATTLNVSTSTDVLEMAQNRDAELLSQSESVIAIAGKQGKKDRTQWFNIIAFDQDSSVAVRKYGFIVEETTWAPNTKPNPGLRFDAEVILDAATLEEPYANANAMKISVLLKTLKLFSDDAHHVNFDNVTLRSSTAMAKQAVNAVVFKLSRSPAEAVRLQELTGMEFDHPTLGKSRVRMLIQGNVVKLKIKSGKPWFVIPFEQHSDVINM